MHKLFNRKARFFTTALVSLATLFFCFQNTYWDLPIVDFRPFKIGTDLPARKKLENEAEAKVKIIGYIMENEKNWRKETLRYS